MQRRNVIHSVSSLAMVSVLPINSFGKAYQDIEQKNWLQANIHNHDFSNNLSKGETQTSIVKCNGQEVKIHAIQTGTVAVKRSHLTNRTAHFLTPIKISLDKHFTEFMPIWAWVIEHPEGVIVIDTGENAEVMNPDYFKPAGKLIAKYSKRNLKFNVSRENEIGVQLRKLGIANESIKNIVLTHLHLDHTDGIKDFPNVEIILNEDEYKKPSGHFPELVPNWFKPKTVKYKNDFIEVFNKAYPLTTNEDLLLIPTNGHTKNHASVLFKTDDFDILFAGDVCYNQKQLIEKDLPGINVNYKESRKTYNNIMTYAQQKNLIFLPSHDMDSAQRLKEKQYLSS
ncbi:MAG: N-acyl homoserine lactonase family protein [Saprospiraceae bacterium]